VGWEWLDLAALAALPFYPRILADRLPRDAAGADFAYLGDSV
jgi:hypothetical protein